MTQKRRQADAGLPRGRSTKEAGPKGPAEAGSTPPPTPAPDDGARDSREATAEEQEERVERDLGDLLADVERERDEYLELARRTKADFDNYRRRVAGEAAEGERRGRGDLVRQLLPVIDNLERALAAATEDSSSLAEGVRLVREELAGVLARSGVESYEPTGEQFDPEWHEAMMTRPVTADDSGKVLEVLEKGYRLDGQVLRPARVVVGAPEENGTSGENGR